MTTAAYYLGTVRQLTVEFRDASQTLYDPSEVNFEMVEPDGMITTYQTADSELEKDGTGLYHVDWTFDQEGRHFVRWFGEGTAAVAKQEEIYILRKASP